jgi:CRP-like cAMP-binding protein
MRVLRWAMGMSNNPQRDEETQRGDSSTSHAGPANRLLQTLPADEYARIAAQLRVVPMKAKQVFHKQGEPIREVYFPEGGACSLTKVMQDGKVAEIATVGNEGMLGVGVFFGDHVSSGEALVQVPDGAAHTMSVEAFIAEMERRGAFYNRIIRYSQAFMTQIMQTTVCNGLHGVEQRCCRWLLMTHDRVRKDEFQLTHDFMAIMLGVRRPTVTLIAAKLQMEGLIRYRRGFITIADRRGLEKAACECYESVKTNFARLLPELPAIG